MSFDRLIRGIVRTQNPTVVGLDPKLGYIPNMIKEKYKKELGNTFEAAAASILEFNCGIIDAVSDIVPAVKPQAAYYEMYGWQGVQALAKTIAYAKSKGLFVIVDAKRNDIGSTMQAYATAHLGTTELFGSHEPAFNGDALTVNPYLGTDGVAPVLSVCSKFDKAMFILVKTSNPSSGELQDLKLQSGQTVYAKMGEMCEAWGKSVKGEFGYSGVGAVVGATYPEQLLELRQKLAHTFFLVPGFGAQGGAVEDVMQAFDETGLGAIINNSRGIMCSWQKDKVENENWVNSVRKAALEMQGALIGKLGRIELP